LQILLLAIILSFGNLGLILLLHLLVLFLFSNRMQLLIFLALVFIHVVLRNKYFHLVLPLNLLLFFLVIDRVDSAVNHLENLLELGSILLVVP
jgi:hypothetical protein